MNQQERARKPLAQVNVDRLLTSSSTVLRVAQDVDELIYNEQGDPTPRGCSLLKARRVLNVPCGAGAWAVETAKTYSHLTVKGIDPDRRLIKVARWYALMEDITNASFATGDLQDMEYLPDESFDVVQVCFLCRLLPPEHWVTTARELLRVCGRRGLLAWTELGALQTNSAACERWYRLLQQAIMQDKHGTEVEALLSCVLRDAGAADIQHEVFTFDLADNSRLAHFLYTHLHWLIWMAEAFLLHHGMAERDDLEALQQEVIHDVLHAKTLQGTLALTTVWAKK